MASRNTTLFAPAKINLYLHVTGRREDGYHDLDSLAVFADIGDRLTIEPSTSGFHLAIEGPYAAAFSAQDRDSGPSSSNLVTRAVWALARAAGRTPDLRITLIKNLPLAAGIGGGSADAAAALWGLMDLWKIPISTPFLPALMRSLGADVPACLRCAPVRIAGIGDILEHIPDLPEIPVVLVNPGKHCATPDVFRRFIGPMRGEMRLPDDLSTPESLIAFLRSCENDLTPAAIEIVPEIGACIAALAEQKNCLLSRMSGSGATVYGLFPGMEEAQRAAETLTLAYPRWWVRVGTINSPERY